MNWNNLKLKVCLEPKNNSNKATEMEDNKTTLICDRKSEISQFSNRPRNSQFVAIDCEMVGVGANGKESALARCAIVDYNERTLYDKFVKPKSFVTDFRTKWSGIRKCNLRTGIAVSFEESQFEVANILKGKIVVGHALKNDLDVLLLSHPKSLIRDTSTYKPYMRPHGRFGKFRPRSLKDLAEQYLDKKIQTGEHNPVEDAKTAMMLYKLASEKWESDLMMKKTENKKIKKQKLEDVNIPQEMNSSTQNETEGKKRKKEEEPLKGKKQIRK